MYATLIFAVLLLWKCWSYNVCAFLNVLQLSAVKQGISIGLKHQSAGIQKSLSANILFVELFDAIENFPKIWETGIFLDLGLLYNVSLWKGCPLDWWAGTAKDEAL